MDLEGKHGEARRRSKKETKIMEVMEEVETSIGSSSIECCFEVCLRSMPSRPPTQAPRVAAAELSPGQEDATSTCSHREGPHRSQWRTHTRGTPTPPVQTCTCTRSKGNGCPTYRIANLRGFNIRAGKRKKQMTKQASAPRLQPAKMSSRSHLLTIAGRC